MLQNDSYLDRVEQRVGTDKWRGRHKPGGKEEGGCGGELSGEPACTVCLSRQQGRAPSGTMKARSSQGTKHVCGVRAGAGVAVTQRCAEWSGRNAIKSVTP